MYTRVLATTACLLAAACLNDPDPTSSDAVATDAPVALSRHAAAGRVEAVLPLTHLTDLPEGIAVDRQGNVFVSDRRLTGDARRSEVLRIAPDNSVSVFATLGETPNGFATGALGLVVGPDGDVYVAFASGNPSTVGVWRIGRRGGLSRLPGSEGMRTPNALAFDARGNLYASDSEDGTIWRFPGAGPGALWLRHPLLAPSPDFGVGANGLAFVPPATLYVANTDFALIARIPIQADGKPGNPEVAAAGFDLLTVDGLAPDAHGDLHAVIAGASIFGTAPVVRVDPATGQVTPSTDERDRFDFPTSLAFGRGPRDHKSVYIVNGGLFPEDRPEASPSVVQVGLEVPGAP